MSEIIMNYYPFHIGDFNNATRHLTRIERSIYRDLIDLYYDKESPLPENIEQVARLICANDCITSVEQVLNEFFYLTDSGWVNDRCEQTLTEYKELSEKRSKAGKASAKARRSLKTKKKPVSTSVEQVLNKCSTSEVQTNNHKPITNNQEPERERRGSTLGFSPSDDAIKKLVLSGFKREWITPAFVAEFDFYWSGRGGDLTDTQLQGKFIRHCLSIKPKLEKLEENTEPEMSQIDRVAAKLEREVLSGNQSDKPLIQQDAGY